MSATQNSRGGISKAIVPAAGIGSRLYPITRSQPKEMLPLGRKPTIQWVAEELALGGIGSILFVTGENKRALENHFDPSAGPFANGKRPLPLDEVIHDPNLRLLYIRQGGPRGLADAIRCGDTFAADDDVVVALGDVVLLESAPGSLVRRLCEVHRARQAAATLAVNFVPDEETTRYGIVDPGASGDLGMALRDVVEKPPPGEAPSNYAITGRYVLSPVVFDYIGRLRPGHGSELQLTDALREMIRDGLAVYGVPLDETEQPLDVGDIPSYWRSFAKVMLADEALGDEMRAFLTQEGAGRE